MIAMRDGVRLATDFCRPARGGVPAQEKLPVLLQRTPYGKSAGRLPAQARYFAAHGYVVALQGCRGATSPFFSKYLGEGLDGDDTIERLARLPYSEGRIGRWGTVWRNDESRE
jgi:putative CocE/NonD family hydrolase